MTDGQFYKIFGILTVGIIIIAIIIAILSNIFASYSFHPSSQYKTEIENSEQIRTELCTNLFRIFDFCFILTAWMKRIGSKNVR